MYRLFEPDTFPRIQVNADSRVRGRAARDYPLKRLILARIDDPRFLPPRANGSALGINCHTEGHPYGRTSLIENVVIS